MITTRLGRAAIFAFSTGAAASMGACGTSPPPEPTSIAQPYGVPVQPDEHPLTPPPTTTTPPPNTSTGPTLPDPGTTVPAYGAAPPPIAPVS